MRLWRDSITSPRNSFSFYTSGKRKQSHDISRRDPNIPDNKRGYFSSFAEVVCPVRATKMTNSQIIMSEEVRRVSEGLTPRTEAMNLIPTNAQICFLVENANRPDMWRSRVEIDSMVRCHRIISHFCKTLKLDRIEEKKTSNFRCLLAKSEYINIFDSNKRWEKMMAPFKGRRRSKKEKAELQRTAAVKDSVCK